jgi:hypothetical protein
MAAHYHHCKLRIDKKFKNTPLPKELILGASVDEMNFHLDQISTNYSLLHFHSSFFHFLLFFGGVLTFKKVGPMCTWVVLGYPGCRKQSAHVHTRLCLIQPAYTLQYVEKNKNQELTPHELVILQDVCPLEREGA